MKRTYNKEFKVSACELVRKDGIKVSVVAERLGINAVMLHRWISEYEEYGEELHFLMVNMSTAFGDTKADAEKTLTDGGYTFPVYYDTNAECAYGYGVTAIPMTFFIDKNGNLVSGKTGMISEADLQRRILTILD